MKINFFSSVGKSIDQPVVVARLGKAVPGLLIGGACIKCGIETYKAPKKKKTNTFIKTALVLAGTIAGALLASRQTLGNFSVKKTIETQKKIAQDILKNNNNLTDKAKKLITKSGEGKAFNPKQIQELADELKNLDETKAKKIMDALIPPPVCTKAKDIMKELGSLSYLGLLPVVGGVAGGITGNIITDKKNWKKEVPNQVKEASFQYLANIFLCNIGAAAALGVLELFANKGQKWASSKTARVIGMASGIMATGVLGGSAIANWISKKFINPIFETKDEKQLRLEKEKQHEKESIFSERKVELADMGLHIDDFATVGVFNGIKFIEPCLPILYSISGYKAGIGYRNGDKNEHSHTHRHSHH